MTPEEIPDELRAMVNEDAGRLHGYNGPVMVTLARVLTRYEEMLVGGRSAAPTPERLFDVISDALTQSGGSHVLGSDVARARNAVVALLSLPAAEPPAVIDETVTVEALPGGSPAAPGQSFITSRMVDALPGTPVQIVEGGVAAGPQATPPVLWEGPTASCGRGLGASQIPHQLPCEPGTRVRVVAVPTGDQEHSLEEESGV